MQKHIDRQVEQVIQYRKQFAALESRRRQFAGEVPKHLWQEFVELSRQLEQAEHTIRQTCQQLTLDTNRLRAEIMAKLKAYDHWRNQTRQIDEQFLLNIVRPGYQLKHAIRQRELLEQAYQCISDKIRGEGYASREELEADIRRVLTYDETASEVQEEVPDDTLEREEALYDTLVNIHVEDVEEAISRETLIKEFKRIVIPKIHPDTSDTPNEVFINVYEVYKREDPLLMEAYIAEYRGEIQTEQVEDVLEGLNLIRAYLEQYQRLLIRLERKFARLKQQLTPQELDNPADLKQKFENQRLEIIQRIQREAEMILFWREKIESLSKLYPDIEH